MNTKLRNLMGTLSLESAFLGVLMVSAPVEAQPQFRTVLFYVNPVGPDGTARAHVGDTITETIRVINEDDFGGTVTVTSVTNIVHRGAGDVVSTNLLTCPVKLDPYLLLGANDALDVTTGFVVQPDDGDLLSVDADVRGTLNFDGPGGSGVPEGFRFVLGDQVRILRPAIQVGLEAPTGNTCRGSVRNTGNTALATMVIVSNVLDGATLHVMGPISLGPRETFNFSLPLDGGSSVGVGTAAGFTLSAFGTDELGLTVSRSVSAGPVLQATSHGQGRILLSWRAIAGRTYQVQYATHVVGGDWTDIGAAVTATGDTAMFLDDMHGEAHRFYRVALVP